MRLTLVLTRKCNLACRYCYAAPAADGATMPLEVGFRALGHAFADEIEDYVELGFFGGEPMIAFDRMVVFTRLARKLGLRTGRPVDFKVTTNGTLLDERRLRFLAHYRFFVGVSLDGLAAVQDRHRPFVSGRGSSRLVWRNVARAAEVLERLSVVMVLNPDMLGTVEESVAAMRDVGVFRLLLSPNLSCPWDEEARAAVSRLYRWLARLYVDTRCTERPLFVHPFVEERVAREAGVEEGETGGCGFGREEVAVAPDGHLYPCPRLVGGDPMPHLRMGHVSQGVSRERAEAVRAGALAAMDGERGCLCVPVMPEHGCDAVKRMGFFHHLVREALDAALQAREPVATAE